MRYVYLPPAFFKHPRNFVKRITELVELPIARSGQIWYIRGRRFFTPGHENGLKFAKYYKGENNEKTQEGAGVCTCAV
jgi:hypothetical protein